MEDYIKKASSRLRQIREESGLLQMEFADKFGVTRSMYNRYELGEMKNMPIDFIENVANAYKVNPSWLIGLYSDRYVIPPVKTRRIPVIGDIPAGAKSLREAEVVEYGVVREDDLADYAMVVKDFSMAGMRIFQGDLVFILGVNKVSNGEIAAVSVNGEFMIRTIYQMPGGDVLLKTASTQFPDIIVPKIDIPVLVILGRITGCFMDLQNSGGGFPPITNDGN